jgi:hypothetical protein
MLFHRGSGNRVSFQLSQVKKFDSVGSFFSSPRPSPFFFKGKKKENHIYLFTQETCLLLPLLSGKTLVVNVFLSLLNKKDVLNLQSVCKSFHPFASAYVRDNIYYVVYQKKKLPVGVKKIKVLDDRRPFRFARAIIGRSYLETVELRNNLSVTHLLFSSLFDSPLFNSGVSLLPETLTDITFGPCFNQPLPPTLPPALKNLKFGDNFNQPLSPQQLGPTFSLLWFGRKFNQPSTYLPSTLTNLVLGENYLWKERDQLPPGLIHLKVGIQSGFLPFHFPPSLLVLSLSGSFLNDHVVLPSRLVRLNVTEWFTPYATFPALPATLEWLVIQGECKVSLPPLPPKLRYLLIYGSFDQALPTPMPDSLAYLHLGPRFNQPLPEILPSSLISLSLSGKYTHPLPQEFPPNLRYFYLNGVPPANNPNRPQVELWGFDHPLPKLPERLKVLLLPPSFNHPLPKNLPRSIESIYLGHRFQQPLIFDYPLPPYLRKIYLSPEYDVPIPNYALYTLVDRNPRPIIDIVASFPP